MKTIIHARLFKSVTAITLILTAAAVHATPLITNGGFESGFAGWTRVDALGSDGTFFLQTGTTSPVNNDPVPPPPEGTQAAMSDGGAAGSHVLYQDFVVPSSAGSAALSFDLFIGNRASDFFNPSPASLDFGINAFNQQARVDILLVGTDPLSVAGTDVLLNVFQTNPGDPLVSGYTTYTANLSSLLAAYAGQTLRLRFAETDNVFSFQLGVDNVNLTVPEPTSILLLSTGLGGLLLTTRRRKKEGGMKPWQTSTGVAGAMAALVAFVAPVYAINPTLTDSNLQVTTVVSGLSQPIGMAFLGPNDFFVTEKATGRVKRVVNGVVTATVLDLPVNSNSERGLLGIALHPNFPTNPSVYLYWTENSIYTVSNPTIDSTVVTEVGNPASLFPPGTPQPLGNRVDRFTWDPTTQTLIYAQNLIRLHAFQNDKNNPLSPNTPTPQGNHNGGQIRFGPDGKLYIQIGDNGRRGWMQNLPNGPYLPYAPDDEFGGPASDDNHVTGVIFRLNDDGTTPTDNPFFVAGAAIGGEAGANIQKLYSYGHRNGFGLAFDPYSFGNLWESENGDDSFDEINKIVPGGNYGWVQIMGPISRIAQFKTIEMYLYNPATAPVGAIQQIRYPTTRIAYSPALALSRMYMLPGATYQDPELSWRYAVPPSGLGFVNGDGLGPEYNGTLWSGEARTTNLTGGSTGNFVGGFLMRFKLTPDRAHLDLSADSRLADRVADNGITYPPPVGTNPNTTTGSFKFNGVESESLLIGQNFGIVTNIQTGPDGNLYVVSNTDNMVYKISRVGP